jgi:hypothetical protein
MFCQFHVLARVTTYRMQILDNSVTNNEIYVMLCDSVQGMESQLQRLHSVLASLRTLSGELRFLVFRDGGGGESTTFTGTTAAITTQAGETTKLSRQQLPTTGNDFEPPELAQIVPVCCSSTCCCCRFRTRMQAGLSLRCPYRFAVQQQCKV